MITKELLSEVLKCNVILVDLKYTESTKRVRYVTDDKNDYYIDVYKLAYLCKEWADEKYDIQIMSCIVNSEGICDLIDSFDRNIKRIDCNTEYGAVFKSCQYILSKS